MTTRRFVLVAGTSAKFWETCVEGTSVVLRWGPLGREGQTKSKAFATTEKAEAEQTKLVAKKLAEGYREEGDAPSEERPRVAWDAKTRALVHPRRASKIPAPKVDVAKAWKLVVAAFDDETRAAAKRGRKEAMPEDRALMDAAIAGFDSKDPPEDPDPLVEGARAALIAMEGHHVNTSRSLLAAHDALVGLWCAAYGVPFAVRAMIETFRTVRCDLGTLYVSRNPDWFGRFGNINRYRDMNADPVDVTPWHVLRAHLAATHDDTYAKARAAAEPVHEAGVDVLFRCALSFVFADEEEWAKKTLEKSSYLVQGNAGSPAIYHCAHALVSCFRDKATIRKFIEAHAFHVEFAWDVLDALGPGAFPMLRDLYGNGRWRDKKAQKQLFAAITLIDSDEVSAWMKRQRHDAVVGALAEAYFSRFS